MVKAARVRRDGGSKATPQTTRGSKAVTHEAWKEITCTDAATRKLAEHRLHERAAKRNEASAVESAGAERKHKRKTSVDPQTKEEGTGKSC